MSQTRMGEQSCRRSSVGTARNLPRRPQSKKYGSLVVIVVGVCTAYVLAANEAESHTDVGGGSVQNGTPHALARISLRWMVRECFKTQTGIMFNSEGLRDIGLDPASLYPIVRPRPPPFPVENLRLRTQKADKVSLANPAPSTGASTGTMVANAAPTQSPKAMTEEEHELHDALSPVYDQLQLSWSWWVFEVIPMRHRFQRGINEWVTQVRMNLAAPRFIPKQRDNGVKVHRSVKLRMAAQPEEENKTKGYQPRAKLLVEPEWVD
jgi:hypothetical protein